MSTKYNIKNNHGTEAVEHFYVDHTASPCHGGFEITTTENCLKSTAGWSRFEIALPAAMTEAKDLCTFQNIEKNEKCSCNCVVTILVLYNYRENILSWCILLLMSSLQS